MRSAWVEQHGERCKVDGEQKVEEHGECTQNLMSAYERSSWTGAAGNSRIEHKHLIEEQLRWQ
eukprot:scaffold1633_cov23-Tisochrysis_lutea.AAC.1